MQTFLPYADFAASARVLDYRRLGKQRVEAKQILTALRDPGYGWQRHPAVKMWRGREGALALYGWMMCLEWKRRGFADNTGDWFLDRLAPQNTVAVLMPDWLGQEAFHASHRSNLLRKDPGYYGQWGWEEPMDLEYVWPEVAE